MLRFPLRTAALMTAALLALTAPSTTAGAASRPSSGDGQLAFASLAPETGSLAPLLTSLRVPVELAVDEINAAGGVNGQPVSVITGDEGDSAPTARSTVARFADAGVDAVIGPAAPSSVLAVLGNIRKTHMLMCSGSDTSAPVTALSSDGLYFRTAPGPELQGRALAELVRGHAHRRVGVVRRADFFGDEMSTALIRALRKAGTRVVADVGYDPARADLDAKVRAVLRRSPDAVVVIGFAADAAQIVARLIARTATTDADPIAIYGPDTMQAVGFAAAVDASDPSAVAGIAGTAPAPAPTGTSSPFLATLAARGVDPIFSAHAYDCTILAALAAVRARSDDPDRMKRAFAATLRGDNDCSTFAACAALLEAGRSVHWRGASSGFDFFEQFEPGVGAYDTWSYDDSGLLQTGDPTGQILVTGGSRP